MKMEIIESDLKQLFQWIKTLESRVIAIEKSVGYAKIEADNKNFDDFINKKVHEFIISYYKKLKE